ncbi:MAG: DegT/DnrJ/EryC1/StrS family aminotransferase, partial [Alphaproteobacteria bacterium]
HLYGQMADMDRVLAVARARGLAVVEDAAQAHGAKWRGNRPGGLSDAACFSFYPGKNLGAWGDGGAVFTRDGELARRIAKRANHGRSDKYRHDLVGVNSRLDGLQAAILRVKLAHLDEWTAKRREIARWYDSLLDRENAIKRPETKPGAEHVFHLYVVEVEERDRVLECLRTVGIGAGIHYPVPLHEQPAYRSLGLGPNDLPATSRAAKRVLSLPLYPEMTGAQAERVAAQLIAAVRDR